MGELRGGGTWKFSTLKRGEPEILPEHWGENLKYLTSKNIKGSFLQSDKVVFNYWFVNYMKYLTSKNIKRSFLQSSKAI